MEEKLRRADLRDLERNRMVEEKGEESLRLSISARYKLSISLKEPEEQTGFVPDPSLVDGPSGI